MGKASKLRMAKKKQTPMILIPKRHPLNGLSAGRAPTTIGETSSLTKPGAIHDLFRP
jgi:hypothetical protein